MVCNSSVNFLLYVMFAPKFRSKVRVMWTDMFRSLSDTGNNVNRSEEFPFSTNGSQDVYLINILNKTQTRQHQQN